MGLLCSLFADSRAVYGLYRESVFARGSGLKAREGLTDLLAVEFVQLLCADSYFFCTLHVAVLSSLLFEMDLFTCDKAAVATSLPSSLEVIGRD